MHIARGNTHRGDTNNVTKSWLADSSIILLLMLSFPIDLGNGKSHNVLAAN